MILVTLGTHPQPMDRLLRELDRLVEAGVIRDEVIVQAAAYGYRPRHIRSLPTIPADEFHRLIGSADVVISHAGPGTLAAVRQAGKTPVVVARASEYREHVDDHQVRYAQRLQPEPGYVVVADLKDLPGAIDRARRTTAESTQPDRSRAIEALERIIGRR